VAGEVRYGGARFGEAWSGAAWFGRHGCESEADMMQPLTGVGQHATISMGNVARQERGMMDEKELATLLKAHRWTLNVRTRRNGRRYIYVQQRAGTRRLERYVAPLSRLQELTEAYIITKLHGNEPDFGAATECVLLGRLSHSVA
jgi:hypothetical protein